MRALLICPYERKITEVEIGGLDSYYRALSYPGHEVDTFDVVSGDGFDVFVDDEGLLKGETSFFQLDGFHSPLAGRGLVTGGADEEGNTVATTMSIDDLKSRVHWLTLI